jgi:hypothetical protein
MNCRPFSKRSSNTSRPNNDAYLCAANALRLSRRLLARQPPRVVVVVRRRSHLIMSTHSEKDEWGTEAPNIMSPERLSTIREVLEESPVIMEHWFFYGSRSPDRLVFGNYEDLDEYLRTRTRPGDAIHVWRYDVLCRDEDVLTHGKCPDADGLTPKKGAY